RGAQAHQARSLDRPPRSLAPPPPPAQRGALAAPRRRNALAWTAAMSSVSLALRFVDYGNSKDWNEQGLLVLAFVVAGAVAVTVVLAVRLEIIKSRRVRDRNRRNALRREQDRSRPD